MHYKNGREAKLGDMIVVKLYDGNIHCGVLATANASSDCCNGTIYTPLGACGIGFNIKDAYHVEDAFKSIDINVDKTLSNPTSGNSSPMINS